MNTEINTENELLKEATTKEDIKYLIKQQNKKTYNPKEYMSEKIVCDCGSISIRSNLSRHKKSKLHEKRMNYCLEII